MFTRKHILIDAENHSLFCEEPDKLGKAIFLSKLNVDFFLIHLTILLFQRQSNSYQSIENSYSYTGSTSILTQTDLYNGCLLSC